MKLNFIENKNINRTEWDNAVNNSINGMIYAYSWYLDVVSPGWCAIIAEDFSSIMPLTTKKKYGINYIMTPLFMQQGGVFSKNPVSKKNVQDFVNEIPKKFRYIKYNFNTGNNFDLNFYKQYGLTMHIDLSASYESIFKGYKQNTVRNLKLASYYNLNYNDEISISDFYDLVSKTSIISKSQKKTLREIVNISSNRTFGKICGVTDHVNNLIAAAVILRSHKKSINLFNISSKEGYNKKAMFLLFDRYFYGNSGQDMIFDFEGSRIPGVARFYKGFGAKTVNFPILHINKLPALMRFFKK